MASFVKQMALSFGMAISPQALRHAILAYAALRKVDSSDESEEQLQLCMAKSSSGLLRKIIKREGIVDADVFAAMLLAWVAMRKGVAYESIAHANGGLALLTYLLRKDPQLFLSPLLKTFEPLLRDNFNTVLAKYGVLDTSSEDSRPSSFAQRKEYFRPLCHTGSPPEAWLTADLEVTYNYLRGALNQSFITLKELATLETTPDYATTRASIANDILGYLQAKLEDTQFQVTLAALDKTVESSRRQGKPLVRYLKIALRSLELLRESAFRKERILDGLVSDENHQLGSDILHAIKEAGSPGHHLRYYRDIYFINLLLCALPLNSSNFPPHGVCSFLF